jgi:hypothetical protein
MLYHNKNKGEIYEIIKKTEGLHRNNIYAHSVWAFDLLFHNKIKTLNFKRFFNAFLFV